MLRMRHLSGAIIAALVFSAAAQAGTHDFDKVVTVGDSLSDNGNISLASGATQPSRFTTNPGKVAVELLAEHYGYTLTPSLAGGTDYAFGGAGILVNSPGTPALVPTITDQVNALLGAGSLNGHTLYTMWGGANDIFYHATAAGAAGVAQQLIQQKIQQLVQQAITTGTIPNVPAAIDAYTQMITPTVTQQVSAAVAAGAGVASLENAAQAQAGVAAAAGQEVNLLGQMHAAGADYVVVFNLPDIGLTPSAAAQGAAAKQALSNMTLLYNGILGSGLNQLSDQGLNVVPVNVYALFNEVAANPSAFGFSNITTPACGAGSSSVQCGPQGSGAPFTYAPGTEDTYLFADGVHPTKAGHAMLAQYVIAELDAPGAASMLAEVPVATTAAHLSTLNTQMNLDSAGATTRTFVGLDFGRQQFDATGDSPETKSHDVNLTLGVDAAMGDQFNMGLALGMTKSTADVGAGSFKLNSILGLGYAHWHQGGGYLSANLGFGQLDYNDITRRFQIGALNRVESGQTSGNVMLGGLGGGWWFGGDSFQTGPFAKLQWQRVSVEGYSEKGSDSSAMWYARQVRTSTVQTLGWQFKSDWTLGTGVLHPFLQVAWNHDDRADPRKVRAGLTGMQGSFALTGFIPDANWTSADLGVSAELGQSTRTWFAYRGQFGRDGQSVNAISLGMSIAF